MDFIKERMKSYLKEMHYNPQLNSEFIDICKSILNSSENLKNEKALIDIKKQKSDGSFRSSASF